MDLPNNPEVPTQLKPVQDDFNFRADYADPSEYSYYAPDFQFALNDSSSSAYAPQTSPHPYIPLQEPMREPFQRPVTLEQLQMQRQQMPQQFQQSQDHKQSTQYYHDRQGGPVLASSNQSSEQISQAGQQAFHPRNKASISDYTRSRSSAASESLFRQESQPREELRAQDPQNHWEVSDAQMKEMPFLPQYPDRACRQGNGLSSSSPQNHMPTMDQPGSSHLAQNDQSGTVPAQATATFSGSMNAIQSRRNADMHNYYHKRGDRRRD